MCGPVLLNYWITCENIVAIQPIDSLKQLKKINNRLNNIGRKKNSVFLQSVQNGEQKEEERKDAER
jgi:hypothetical protein